MASDKQKDFNASKFFDRPVPDIPMPIKTSRLLMRPIAVDDAAAVLDYKRESWTEFARWMIWTYPPSIETRTLEDEKAFCAAKAERFKTGADITLLAFCRETGRLIGSGGLHKPDWKARTFSVGFAVRTGKTGHGYGTEIAQGLVTYAFDVLGAKRLFSMHATGNTPSGRVLTKIGFIPDPTHTGRHELPTGWTDECHYRRERG